MDTDQVRGPAYRIGSRSLLPRGDRGEPESSPKSTASTMLLHCTPRKTSKYSKLLVASKSNHVISRPSHTIQTSYTQCNVSNESVRCRYRDSCTIISSRGVHGPKWPCDDDNGANSDGHEEGSGGVVMLEGKKVWYPILSRRSKFASQVRILGYAGRWHILTVPV
ncbi:hypothetical protein L873DRAFT_807504 [Choiromyces venosus 120613-1]|uniref:Uncharacterized protein n=1 Tax=Choiromyces venosus 120613-1 TaxID=1336337 RepID=A0A3N4K7X5_9PEZI|nr:hypothetical protein L873DRAFT_807504 [Choiromyces venosus 120613-1]